ncbi:MAG: cupin [Anaerolineaceae bacterium]|nr:cupin [Anaerolineaceae bacterium]
MSVKNDVVRITRWTGGQHPTLSSITRKMKDEGLRPYMWLNTPNHRYAVRTHGYDKVLYVVEGSVEVNFPDSNQRVTLRAGDRTDIPAGVRHGTIVGNSGARCVEASIARR